MKLITEHGGVCLCTERKGLLILSPRSSSLSPLPSPLTSVLGCGVMGVLGSMQYVYALFFGTSDPIRH